MKVFANSDIGLVRSVNEDDYCVFQNPNNDWLAVVCDGIGGNAGGEVASHIVVSTLRDAFLQAPAFQKDYEVNQWIHHQLNKANDAIFKQSSQDLNLKGMGTTCVGIMITKTSSYIFNVGDSRIYADYSDGLIQMSEDHSVIAQLLREGKITLEQAKNHIQKNTLTNALGIWHLFRIDINKIQSNYKYILICSDGLHGYVEHEVIQNIVENPKFSIQDKVNHLMLEARLAGGLDNCTIILIESDRMEESYD
ncbi:MAG: Stp1/IreP family PP2C-type Ser/Thr phosphatase [Floccifex sp.]